MSINQALWSPFLFKPQFALNAIMLLSSWNVCLPTICLAGTGKWITSLGTKRPILNSLTLVMSYQMYIILCELSEDCQTVSFILKLSYQINSLCLVIFSWDSLSDILQWERLADCWCPRTQRPNPGWVPEQRSCCWCGLPLPAAKGLLDRHDPK